MGKKRLRKLERRIRRLEARRDLPPVNRLRNHPINIDGMWRSNVTDFSAHYAGEEDEGWQTNGYM